MPFRSRAVLESWLAEYAAASPGAHSARVALQEEEDGQDSGLVVVQLVYATTSVFMQPAAPGAPEWRLTFEARPDPIEASSSEVRLLAEELAGAADLLDFLEEKSRRHIESAGAGSPTAE